MCGICGWHSEAPPLSARPLIERMIDRLHARGPDQRGSVACGPVSLGAARLAIVDVEGGRQPFTSEDGRTAAVFNGEIFNDEELRQTLIDRGHTFRSSCDGEVLVHAHEEWGDLFVERLNGMFAFALWDGRREALLLCRDRIGIKPLYYHHSGRGLFFASEIKSLREVPGLSFNLDGQALGEYLVLEYIPAPRSIYGEVKKLRPGQLLRLERGELHLQDYWRLSPGRGMAGIDPEEARARADDLIGRAVRRQLRADVPVGVLLSGGIDSSLVAAHAAAASSPLAVFTVGFEEPSFDERRHATAVAAHLGADLNCQILDVNRALDVLPRVAAIHDEPLGDASAIPTYVLCEAARQQVKVVLTGDGGDETFIGYPTYQAHQVAPLFSRLPRAMRGPALGRLIDGLPVSHRNFSLDFKLRAFVAGFDDDLFTRHLRWMGSFAPSAVPALLRPEWRFDCATLRERFAPDLAPLAGAPAPLGARLLDFVSYLPYDLLYKVDTASMAHGLEARPPLLDHELVEFAFGLPLRYHLTWRRTKVLLKGVAASRLPAAVVHRRKKGFGIPIAEWLVGPRGQGFLRYLERDTLERVGLLQPAPVRQLVEEHLSRRRNHRKQLWTLIALQSWALHHLGDHGR